MSTTTHDPAAIGAYAAAIGPLGRRATGAMERFVAIAPLLEAGDDAPLPVVRAVQTEWRDVLAEARALRPPPAMAGAHVRALRWFGLLVDIAADIVAVRADVDPFEALADRPILLRPLLYCAVRTPTMPASLWPGIAQ